MQSWQIKQEIYREMVVWPNMPVETSCEQEKCVDLETCDMSLPELYKAKENVHTNEVKLDVPIEQDKFNLHTRWKKVLGSKVIRKGNPLNWVKREVCRPPPKQPYILNINGEVKM